MLTRLARKNQGCLQPRSPNVVGLRDSRSHHPHEVPQESLQMEEYLSRGEGIDDGSALGKCVFIYLLFFNN